MLTCDQNRFVIALLSGKTTEQENEMPEECVIPPGGYWSGTVPEGYRLRIIDLEGGQGVDFLCYNADQHAERYHAPNTLRRH